MLIINYKLKGSAFLTRIPYVLLISVTLDAVSDFSPITNTKGKRKKYTQEIFHFVRRFPHIIAQLLLPKYHWKKQCSSAQYIFPSRVNTVREKFNIFRFLYYINF